MRGHKIKWDWGNFTIIVSTHYYALIASVTLSSVKPICIVLLPLSLTCLTFTWDQYWKCLLLLQNTSIDYYQFVH